MPELVPIEIESEFFNLNKVKLGSCHLLSSLNVYSNICVAKINGLL